MSNFIYLETFNSYDNYKQTLTLKVPLESLISFCIYKYCCPDNVELYFTNTNKSASCVSLELHIEDISFLDPSEIPWQAASCVFPVVLHEDTVITGLCAVARHICKYRNSKQGTNEHEEGLLGFRKSCLQAPNEVSIWTKFCEIDSLKTVLKILELSELREIPINMVRFENHLSKPVRIHNVYKVARDKKREGLESKKATSLPERNETKDILDNLRTPKPRKWKSNIKKDFAINCSLKTEELSISHQFAEGPFLTLADIILFPSYYIFLKSLGENIIEKFLPLSFKWYKNLSSISELKILTLILNEIKHIKTVSIHKFVLWPETDDVSLYKSDPKRHNPKKRIFTKPEDIENAINTLTSDLELNILLNENNSSIDWQTVPDGANPSAGHLPDVRVNRKSQQLENLTLAVTSMAQDGDLIVDFCSGSGHLGILIAHLLPKCTVILLENKEQSLLRARHRVHEMRLKNVFFFQCNLDFFVGKFNIGVALHACGIASDLVLDKCLKANAKFVLCPCCYGSLHATDRLNYPRSKRFSDITIDNYLCIGHTADQTHDNHPLTERGARCMAIIDSDRGRLAEEHGYTVTLSKLKPLSCTPKNNLLIGVPS
ncbi:glutathione S-transferase C-terminal domain-containing protein homolog [Pieris brassicae]|uniref:glutathione S-transferase C-terminal domain-containing protein homolog n=1 Tax=Pieris brassicae TaxID=7116 RepID=UPI001E660B5E|nr:glutathione S-transferase C-terminal domain-containing protein homolog [Pieris brassicae]